jgi:hypothetical protein
MNVAATLPPIPSDLFIVSTSDSGLLFPRLAGEEPFVYLSLFMQKMLRERICPTHATAKDFPGEEIERVEIPEENG